MIRKFIDREQELNFLSERWKSNRFELIVLYGRRRIGKTELIRQFIKDKPHVYFLCDKRGTEENIERFKRKISLYLGEPMIASNDLEEVFKWLVEKVEKRLIVAFDEFSYLAEKDASIPSLFQRAIDNVLIKSRVFLVLCGSSVSMMEKGILSYKSPLYGRKTGHLKMEGLPFHSYFDFFPKGSMEKHIEFYSILGGIPFYMEKFSDNLSTFENVKREIASKSGRLYEEPDFLLKEELREPDVYKKVIEAISLGNTKLVEIANYSKLLPNQLTRYLSVLMGLGILRRETNVIEKKPKSKKSIYSIDDNFFDFYFRFVEPFKSELAIGEFESFTSNFFLNFNAFVGKKFEKLLREELIHKIFGSKFSKVGRWWGWKREEGERKSSEIDIVALNEKTKEILFGETKWKTAVNAEKVVRGLAEKSECVQWFNRERKDSFAIFAKSFSKRIENWKGKKVYCFDLKALKNLCCKKI